MYFDLLVASLGIERSPCNFDLEGLAERCTVAGRWKEELGLAGHLDYTVDSCPLPDPDLLTMNFAVSSRLSVWLEGLAEFGAVPLSPAYISRVKPGSALAYFGENPRLADTVKQGEAPVTVPMMVCYSGLGITAEASRVGPYVQKGDWRLRLRKKEKGGKTKAAGEQFWVTEKTTDAPKAAGLLNPRL